ncbi:amino acid ABC transporter permease [uncultured Propionivibrio sp.]|uniref:amino acid ABC transporter permease n=1 Tax=uncultured Propionivibrio sp. TaxID=426737 RepID=UPI0029C07B10|nr:amino acid ABC transporter permease [uncultured Propionivibrio sp.]
MLAHFDFDVIARTWQVLLFQGLVFTLQVTALSMLGGIVFGTLLAMMRLSSNVALSRLAAGYVNAMRSLPLVLVIFWFYFLMPYIGAWVTGASQPIRVGAFASALITFILFEACFYCEIMRAGIQSIPRGQANAGYALGFSYWQVMSQIILPQAFRNMLPVLLTQTIVLFQDVSLVYIISLPDFVTLASKIAQRDGRLVEMYVFVALVYFVVCLTLSQVVKRLQTRLAVATH